MLLLLRKLGDFVREFQRLRKIIDRKDASQTFDPVELDDFPVRNLGMQFCDLGSGHGWGVLATCDALHLHQCLHRADRNRSSNSRRGTAASDSSTRSASSSASVAVIGFG